MRAKTTIENFRLIGHLQVIDEPLVSLYTNLRDNRLYLFVRNYEYDGAFILAEVKASDVLEYFENKLGLKSLFNSRIGYSYLSQEGRLLSSNDFTPINNKEKERFLNNVQPFDMFDEMYGLDEVFTRHYLYDRIMTTKVPAR